MAGIVFYKELEGLPEELERWCEKALAQIESPEKRDEAASDLREKIEKLLKECPAQDLEEKTRDVLRKLGKAEVVAVELKQTYETKYNKKTDKIIGCICVTIGMCCGIISFVLFYSSQNRGLMDAILNDMHGMHGVYQLAVSAGASGFAAIFLIIFGIRVLLYSRSERK